MCVWRSCSCSCRGAQMTAAASHLCDCAGDSSDLRWHVAASAGVRAVRNSIMEVWSAHALLAMSSTPGQCHQNQAPSSDHADSA